MSLSSSFVIAEPKKFFISFKEESGKDYALHLYYFLKERDIDVFLSSKDIEFDMNRGTWREQIDRALRLTKIFILLITTTASTAPEILREFKKVKDDKEVQKYVFIHSLVWDNDDQTTLRFANGSAVNLKEYQAESFETEYDLVRKIYYRIPTIQEIEFKKT